MTSHPHPATEARSSVADRDALTRLSDPQVEPPSPPIGPSAGRALENLTFAPTTRVLRRSRHEIQIERAGQAVIISHLPEGVLAQLGRRPDRDHAAPAIGPDRPTEGAQGEPLVDEAEIGRVLRSLAGAGYLTTKSPAGPAPRPVSARDVALLPDLVALDDRFGTHAPTVLHGRSHRFVRVHGTGRLAPLIAALSAAAGIGRVHAPDSADVLMSDALPGGLRPEDEGQRTAAAVAEAIRRARPGASPGADPGQVADLVIAAEGHPVRPHLRAVLHADRGPHLIAGVWGSSGVIGPLIVPGRTSCLGCADLHRSDRDPAWPALAPQLTGPPARPIPSEIAVCALTAAIAAVQAIAFLDGERPATLDGTLEFRLPDWRVRRRHWSRHGQCTCAA